MGDCFRQHGFAAPWGAVHEHASWGVYADLLVELEVGEGQFYGFSHLLLLNIHTTFEGEIQSHAITVLLECFASIKKHDMRTLRELINSQQN